MDQAPHTSEVSVRILARTAATDGTQTIGDAPEDATVTGVTFSFDAAVTGDATNNRTLVVRNAGQDGTGTTTVATLAFGAGVNAAAGDEVAATLSGTPANLNVAAGDVLEVVETHGGTGLANPGGVVEVTLARR